MLEATPAETIHIHRGLAEIAADYDGYIVDLWGVLHDGVKAYPGAPDALHRLKQQGKRIVLLSNAPRRAEPVARRTAEIGIPPDSYDSLLTSGEDTWQHLHHRPDPWYAALGRRVYGFMAERDLEMLDGLGLERVHDVADAEFLLATGVEDNRARVEEFEPALRAAAIRGLQMVCANPDLVIVRDGVFEICAGTLAQRYEALGGQVRYHGKPYPELYQTCFARLGLADRSRIVAVGDSLRTDVAGARNVAIDSLLVTGGIHAEELGGASGRHPDPQRLAAVCAQAGVCPTAAIPAFVW